MAPLVSLKKTYAGHPSPPHACGQKFTEYFQSAKSFNKENMALSDCSLKMFERLPREVNISIVLFYNIIKGLTIELELIIRQTIKYYLN